MEKYVYIHELLVHIKQERKSAKSTREGLALLLCSFVFVIPFRGHSPPTSKLSPKGIQNLEVQKHERIHIDCKREENPCHLRCP